MTNPCDVLEALMIAHLRYGYGLLHPRTVEGLKADCPETRPLEERMSVALERSAEA